MSVRRTIYTGQDAHRVNIDKVKSLLENLSATGQVSGKLSDAQIANLSRLLVERGISIPEVSSIVAQSTATQRRIDANILGGDDALHYSMYKQHEITFGHDSPDNPNFAIRFPGETELVLRRQTLGSLLMLQAAYLSSADTDSPHYPTIFGKSFLAALGVPEPPSMPLHEFHYAMLFAACAFAYGNQREGADEHMQEAMQRAGLHFFTTRERSGSIYEKVSKLEIDCKQIPRPDQTGCLLAARLIATKIDRFEFESHANYRRIAVGAITYHLNNFTMQQVTMR